MRQLVFALTAIAAAATAYGDGMMFAPREVGRTVPLVRTPAQEALLATDRQTVTVILRTHFESGPAQLAWLVPVPSEPTNIAAEDEKVFSNLDRATAPRFYTMVRNKSHFSCGCAADPGDETKSAATVRVLSSGVAGVFDFHTLSATRTDELVTWLTDNGYHVPAESSELMERYVKRGYFWLAMKIRAEKASEPTLAPHPVTYTYSATDLVFPLVISRMNTAETNEIILHVAAESRYAGANWTNATIDATRIFRQAGSPSGTNYEALFKEKSQPDSHVLITEFAGDVARSALPAGAQWTLRYVTRLRGLVRAQAMDRDIELAPTTLGNMENEIRLSSISAEVRNVAWFGVTTATSLCLSMAVLKGRWRFRSRDTR